MCSSSPPANDTASLVAFQSLTDSHAILSSNWTGSDACSSLWFGVRCDPNLQRVISLTLPSLHLRGPPSDPLSRLDQLRLLDLRSNRLNGSLLPILSSCRHLKLLYLSDNDFSGPIPDEIGALSRLARLDLSNNDLRGPIPRSLSKLPRLLTLRLQDNVLSGEIPDLAALPSLRDFNASNNQLSGRVPDGLVKRFGLASLSGNAGLCGGGPFFPTCTSPPPPSSGPSAAVVVVPSNPSQIPGSTTTTANASSTAATEAVDDHKGLSTGAIVAIAVGNAVVLLAIVSFSLAYYCSREESESAMKKNQKKKKKKKKKEYFMDENKESAAEESESAAAGTAKSKLVFFDRRKQFELEELLRASAEMVGKGSLGTVYRAVLEDVGGAVAVKRLRDANPCSRSEFERYMDLIGRLRHPNLVRLRAYYYAKEEKLLIYDFLPNRTLYHLLHANRGGGGGHERVPLDWTTRIRLVLGAARGLARVHVEYAASRIPHGNVKSANVLLDKNGAACLSDFGLALLLNPVHATSRLGGYAAPEQAATQRLSQEADVYAFGVLLLEVLTARTPSDAKGMNLPEWVRSVVREEWTAEVFDAELLRYKNIEDELVAMLHVGLACVACLPEDRPTMAEVVKMIEDIRVEQSPLRDDMDESRTSLATTEDGRLSY
ncbi:putative leucine-rich repeat receptor-like protein kinase [Acorus gramineus]|uniref:Leucine-rich repeat receptor-like protein kinase n=1 Tax=Acorus gramineus TaxID=55184 RepID=A0AAV9AJ84_ACOGR|nr:putative leucine-rich repeat receptor-like protein kinase [Acorus gramineus]